MRFSHCLQLEFWLNAHISYAMHNIHKHEGHNSVYLQIYNGCNHGFQDAHSTELYLQVSDNQYGTHSLKPKFFSELRVRECK